MQRNIVNGRLICSKEEAATLAALQLRIQSWPEDNIDIRQEDDYHRLNIRLNDERSSTINSLGLDNKSSSLSQRNISNLIHIRLSDIYCCKRVDYNFHKSKKPYLPPNFRHSNDISKLIKVSFYYFFLTIYFKYYLSIKILILIHIIDHIKEF
ncbi:unnamed protein product [Rotaria sp. Silwood2]|nr:unnamed protein product [Rotaria sp. Silwood2]CAF4766759.1 unnamed protein product [Rotaria sp. Silwood2]